MIRTKDKILAEVNDPNTVLAEKDLVDNSAIVGDGNKAIRSLESVSGIRQLIASRKDGTVVLFNISSSNIVIGTDSIGEIKIYDRSEVE